MLLELLTDEDRNRGYLNAFWFLFGCMSHRTGTPVLSALSGFSWQGFHIGGPAFARAEVESLCCASHQALLESEINVATITVFRSEVFEHNRLSPLRGLAPTIVSEVDFIAIAADPATTDGSPQILGLFGPTY